MTLLIILVECGYFENKHETKLILTENWRSNFEKHLNAELRKHYVGLALNEC